MTSEKMTSRRQPTQTRSNFRAMGMAALLASATVLGGCSLLPSASEDATSAADSATTPASAAAQEGAVSATQAPEVKTPAQELQEKVKASLTTLAAGAKSPNREQMMQAMVKAGAVQEKVEISVDITPTGLAVDATETATLVDKECVVGQVRAGSVAVTILPVLASGRCFVGDTH
ncbi:DUF6993 domain-containing protein [Arthrobacter alpinus]|uniref:DUF6993 domain-containing protein n=1 Tax=Arthrobacter alpinus TaxID=656366 RepID=UPI001EF62F73|nr:hypothetical protein [Arthrobacter alpinus]